MPYYATSQEWLRQSALLLEARPTTTRITTKYSIAKPKARKSKTTAADSSITKPPRGNITIKTFDPASGATLKYKTTKAAEVGRLIGCLGRLGTRMTGLPGDSADLEVVVPGAAPAAAPGEDVAMEESAAPSGAATPAVAEPAQKAAGGGGKGKKKKGKK